MQYFVFGDCANDRSREHVNCYLKPPFEFHGFQDTMGRVVFTGSPVGSGPQTSHRQRASYQSVHFLFVAPDSYLQKNYKSSVIL